MKPLIMFLLSFIAYHTSLFAQCEPSTFVFSMSPGVTQSGAFFQMEGGIWPIEGKLGVMAGPFMYGENIHTAKGIENTTQLDFSGRVIYKLTRTGSNCPQLITAFATVRGLVGGSYRAYWSLGETALLGIKPMYVSRLGAGINILFTQRL
jgi:hypothetical protein